MLSFKNSAIKLSLLTNWLWCNKYFAKHLPSARARDVLYICTVECKVLSLGTGVVKFSHLVPSVAKCSLPFEMSEPSDESLAANDWLKDSKAVDKVSHLVNEEFCVLFWMSVANLFHIDPKQWSAHFKHEMRDFLEQSEVLSQGISRVMIRVCSLLQEPIEVLYDCKSEANCYRMERAMWVLSFVSGEASAQ